MDKGAYRAIVHGVTESNMTQQLTHAYLRTCPVLKLRQIVGRNRGMRLVHSLKHLQGNLLAAIVRSSASLLEKTMD